MLKRNPSNRALYEALMLAEGLVMFTSPNQLTNDEMSKLFESIVIINFS